MLRKLFILNVLIGLIIVGCSNQDNVVSPDNSGNQVGAVDAEFEAFMKSAVESEEVDASHDMYSKLAFGRFSVEEISGPMTITKPGVYQLSGDFSTDHDGITIKSNFVFLALGNNMITGPGNKEGRGVVIEDSRFVYVQGGKFMQFGNAVAVMNSSYSSIRYTNIMGGDEFADPPNGIAPQIGIMLQNSHNNYVVGNYIADINLGIFVRGRQSFHNRIFRNNVMGGQMGLLAICYNPVPGEGDAGPHGDNVKFNYLSRFGTGIQTSVGSERNMYYFNTIEYFNEAYHDYNGSNKFKHNNNMKLDSPDMDMLTLNISGLGNLGSDYAYEGWVIVDGSPVSTGVFTVDDNGIPSQTEFEVSSHDLLMATKFVLTIEPSPDPDPSPSSTHYLAGDFSGSEAMLTVADPAALGDDFTMAMGTFILNTPSTGSDDTDYHAGIWWLDPTAGPGPTLDLPTLPAGWEYEGWVVGLSGPITTGKFTSVSGYDSDQGGPTAGPDPVPPFPGQDYINPLMSLIGYKAVITIEPMPDNSPMPFALKPLVDGNIEDVGIGMPQSMNNNAGTFPSGSAER